MVAKKIKTTSVSKENYSNYLGKAKQFYSTMMMSLADREWDTVLLLGVHAAISITDALLVFHVGKRSISKAHQDAVSLLIQSFPNKDGIRQNANRLSQILNEKHKIEYEPRRFTEKEAYHFAKSVERYLNWSLEQLPK